MQKIIAWIMVILGAMHALFPVAPTKEIIS